VAIRSDLGWSTADRITVLGKDLPGEILGKVNLGDMAFLELTGRVPETRESKLFNAMVVTLVEHGVTPSALVARLTYLGAPEAMQAAVAGGLLGLGLGVGFTQAMSAMIQQPVVLTPQIMLIGLSFAVAVGIFFGFYPAIRAARLNPIEALRYE